VVAGFSLIIAVLALFLQWALWKENIYVESVLGSALILARVGLANARSRNSNGKIALSE